MGIEPNWRELFAQFRRHLYGAETLSVNAIAEQKRDPYRVLISTMISLRTKDEVTAASSARLFGRADTPTQMLQLDEKTIAELIFPAGFYRNKARHIRECSQIIQDRFGGTVPSKQEDLLGLPGVGIKTANLTLNLGFNIPAICVDTHVHRISNRMGWVNTDSPEKTEVELRKQLPKKYWIEINKLLVLYGKKTCTPQSPHCSRCPVRNHCAQVSVVRSR